METEITAEEMIAEFYNETHYESKIIATRCAVLACDRIIETLTNIDRLTLLNESLFIDKPNQTKLKIEHYKEVKQILESKL